MAMEIFDGCRACCPEPAQPTCGQHLKAMLDGTSDGMFDGMFDTKIDQIPDGLFGGRTRWKYPDGCAPRA